MARQTFTTHRGLAVPLSRSNVDTDVIIRMNRCAEFDGDQLGPWAFEALRTLPDGQIDSTCVFNDPRFAQASVLVAGRNFGCGSSREMAVWALAGMGLRCVIAPSYGDIFYANCFQNGMLPIRLPSTEVASLLLYAADGSLTLEIDLAAQVISGAPTGDLGFEIEPLRKSMLMQGLDEISMTLTHDAATSQWQRRDRALRPWLHVPFTPGN
jgi:3-isopropylmalate/(R)-2-methylmalate dehydratase small subunit